jgi:hypothetical protein
VLDEHPFRDRDLYYRFRADEADARELPSRVDGRAARQRIVGDGRS